MKVRLAIIKREETVAILQRGDRFYCLQVEDGKAWQGLWRFPDFDPARMKKDRAVAQLKYGITKYSVTMRAVTASWKSLVPARGRYLTIPEMESLAFAAPHRKLAKFLSSIRP